jgi:hypothetical protein
MAVGRCRDDLRQRIYGLKSPPIAWSRPASLACNPQRVGRISGLSVAAQRSTRTSIQNDSGPPQKCRTQACPSTYAVKRSHIALLATKGFFGNCQNRNASPLPLAHARHGALAVAWFFVMYAVGVGAMVLQPDPISALDHFADSSRTSRGVREVPKADSCTATKSIVTQSPRRRGRAA